MSCQNKCQLKCLDVSRKKQDEQVEKNKGTKKIVFGSVSVMESLNDWSRICTCNAFQKNSEVFVDIIFQIRNISYCYSALI